MEQRGRIKKEESEIRSEKIGRKREVEKEEEKEKIQE